MSNESNETIVVKPDTILDTVIAVYGTLNTVILYACLIIEILWFIMFIYRIYKKEPGFVTPYYIIMLIGYFVNIVTGGIFIPTEILKANFRTEFPEFLQIIYNAFYWYMWRFMGPWNTVLAFNRLTGMFFYRKHDKIWKGFNFTVILILLLLYPFIIFSPYLRVFFYCLPKAYDHKDCIEFYGANVSYSNLANGIISLVFGIATAMARKIRGQTWAKKQKFETYLMIQSIVSTMFLCLSEGSVIVRLNVDYFNFPVGIQLLFVVVENWFGQLFYCSSAILIFCLSKSVRQSFISFYRLYFIPGIKNPQRNQVLSINSYTNS